MSRPCRQGSDVPVIGLYMSCSHVSVQSNSSKQEDEGQEAGSKSRRLLGRSLAATRLMDVMCRVDPHALRSWASQAAVCQGIAACAWPRLRPAASCKWMFCMRRAVRADLLPQHQNGMVACTPGLAQHADHALRRDKVCPHDDMKMTPLVCCQLPKRAVTGPGAIFCGMQHPAAAGALCDLVWFPIYFPYAAWHRPILAPACAAGAGRLLACCIILSSQGGSRRLLTSVQSRCTCEKFLGAASCRGLLASDCARRCQNSMGLLHLAPRQFTSAPIPAPA